MAGTIERKCGAAAPSGAALIAVMLAEPVRKTGESSSSESSARRAGHEKQMGEPDHMPASIRYGQNSGASASPSVDAPQDASGILGVLHVVGCCHLSGLLVQR